MRVPALLLLCCFLSACAGPKDVAIPANPALWQSELSGVFQRLSEDERVLLAGFLTRARIGEGFGRLGVPRDITVGRAIQNERDYLERTAQATAEREAALQQRAALRQTIIERINSVVAVQVDDVRVQQGNARRKRTADLQQVWLTLHNQGQVPIRSVVGEAILLDTKGTEVARIGFRSSTQIAPGQSVSWHGERVFDSSLPGHQALTKLRRGQYATRFDPSSVAFADGSQLSVAE
ncbi:hypothetical protein ACDA63_08525 [Uliginosibacterium sp. sgz301328]|uniref:hypothetical protein n=1 Tax=Uliginosibacterium sp. sgz301328 TaxID=3243764 RepID=UPI00359D562F